MFLSDAPSGVATLARQVDQYREDRDRLRLQPATVYVWDGDFNLRAVLVGDQGGRGARRSNRPGEIEFSIGPDHYLWDWFMARRAAKLKQNTVITVEKDGARISGIVDSIRFKKVDGLRTCVVHAVDDIEILKSVRIWSNPVLPAILQFPRVFMLAGPAVWALKTTIFLNLMRLQNSLFTFPDDPLDFRQWGANLDMRNWQVAIKGGSWVTDSSPHAIVSSRFKTAYDLAFPICEDAGLAITYRRFLPGDPDPWPGYRPRYGQLIFDIEDKSRKFGVQNSSGNVLTGLARTVLQLGSDFVEQDRRVVTDPGESRDISVAGTTPGVPWVVYRETDYSGVETSDYEWKPATHTNLVVGGHSMSGVNETISSAVQLAGDLASSTFIGPNVNLGQIADTVLKPLYVDTLLAWMALKLFARAQQLGWVHFLEYMPTDGDRAYQLSSVLAMRRAAIVTGEKFTHTIKIADGAPHLIGDHGFGDVWVDDLIASEPPGTPGGQLLVDRVSEAEFTWGPDGAGWQITVGDLAQAGTGWDRIVDRIKTLGEALADQGVL